MTNLVPFNRSSHGQCPPAEELGRYAAGSSAADDREALERHLSECVACREELAGLIHLLHPKAGELQDFGPEPSAAEVAEAFAVVREVAERERVADSGLKRWIKRGALAAAAAVLVLIGASALRYYWDTSRSEQFLVAARAELEGVYPGSSPRGLRLDLPFHVGLTRRDASPEPSAEVLDRSATLFHQALAVRESLPEAHLGLGAVYLGKSQFDKARHEFQKVLDVEGSNPRALLGRGVATYEQALESKDPVQRQALMDRALADFDAVLRQNPQSLEARYNRIWIHFELGGHERALGEIEAYLRKDSSSIWAVRLQDLRLRIQLSKPNAVREAVDRAGPHRDSALLQSIVRLLPDSVPAAVQSALRRSLEAEGAAALAGSGAAGDLEWAAETLAAAYASARNDNGYLELLKYHRRLQPVQRVRKRVLDSRLTQLKDSYLRGDVASVLVESESLAEGFTDLQDRWQLLNLYHLRGSCFYYRAEFEKAEREYRRMLTQAEGIGSPDLVARSLAALGAALSEQNRLEEDLALTTRLKALADRHGMEYWQAYASRNLGSIYLLMDRLGESAEAFLEALPPANQLREEGLLVGSLENLGLILDRSGRLREARDFYALALRRQEEFSADNPVQEKIAAKSRYLNLLYRSAELSLRLGDLDNAEVYFSRSLEGALDGMRELECRNRVGLARVYLEKGRLGDAASMVSRSLQIAEAGSLTDLLWQAQLLQARLSDRKGDFFGAVAALERATRTVEQLSGEAPAGELGQSFITRKLEPHREIVSLLLRSPTGEDRAREYADRAKSKALRDYLTSQRASSRSLLVTGLGRGAGNALPRHAILDYFFASRELVVFLSVGDRHESITLPVAPSRAEEWVGSYLKSIQSDDEAGFQKLSSELHDSLIAPVLPRLQADTVHTLVICPDGPLYRLPFAGLRDRDGRYLIERYALAYSPSRSILDHCLSLRRNGAKSTARSVLLVDGSATLRGAEDELVFLTRLYGKNSSLMQVSAVDGTGRQAGGAEIIHFAGHSSEVNGRPALLLAGGRGRNYLDVGAISSWNLERNLLVNLSACATGTVSAARGAMPWGLVPAFLNAGAPALLVSLTSVDDRATQQLNARFYESLANGLASRAAALRSAQLSLLAETRAAGRFHPVSWIPFVLVGDPR